MCFAEISHCMGNMRASTVHEKDDWPSYLVLIYISNEVLKNEEKGVASYEVISSG